MFWTNLYFLFNNFWYFLIPTIQFSCPTILVIYKCFKNGFLNTGYILEWLFLFGEVLRYFYLIESFLVEYLDNPIFSISFVVPPFLFIFAFLRITPCASRLPLPSAKIYFCAWGKMVTAICLASLI